MVLAYLLSVVGSLVALAVILRPRPVPTAPAPRVPAPGPAPLPPAAEDDVRAIAYAVAQLAARLTA